MNFYVAVIRQKTGQFAYALKGETHVILMDNLMSVVAQQRH